MPDSPIASTRQVTTTGPALPDWMAGLGQYTAPNVNLGTTTASSMVGDPLAGDISQAPNLDKIAKLVSQINQQAYLSAPGRGEELANIQRWQRGELDPEVYADLVNQAATTYGGGGFGVDSPAWQAAVRRAIGLQRQGLEEKGAAALNQFYGGLPTTDVGKYTVTPTEFAAAQDAAKARQLQLAQLQQQGALETARLAQQRALSEEELALKREQWDIAKRAELAKLYASRQARNPWATFDWRRAGYAGAPVVYGYD